MFERTFYVYIMSSLSRTLYTGVTNDLERRVAEHREGQNKASFTARYNVNLLVYFEEFSDVNAAIAREKEIKRLTRNRKIRLIELLNPAWTDLCHEWDKATQPSSHQARLRSSAPPPEAGSRPPRERQTRGPGKPKSY
jgi:putative endonuclease